jgi:hypothetical protein
MFRDFTFTLPEWIKWFTGKRLDSVEMDSFGGHVWKEITVMYNKRKDNERKDKSKGFRGRIRQLILCGRQYTYWNITSKPHKRIIPVCLYNLYVSCHIHVDPLIGKDGETNNETAAFARQQLWKYAIVLEPLLGSGPRATMEVLLEALFCMWSAPRIYHSTDRV